jgi:hypothetical protein
MRPSASAASAVLTPAIAAAPDGHADNGHTAANRHAHDGNTADRYAHHRHPAKLPA